MSSHTTDSPWGDPDTARALLDEQVAAAQARAQKAQQMRADIDAVRGKGRSPRGEVTATCDASGALTALALSDEAMEYSARALSDLIVRAAGDARRDAGERAVHITADVFGDDSQTTALMRREIEEREATRTTGLR